MRGGGWSLTIRDSVQALLRGTLLSLPREAEKARNQFPSHLELQQIYIVFTVSFPRERKKKCPLNCASRNRTKGPSLKISKPLWICTELHLLCENPMVFSQSHSSCLAIGPCLARVGILQFDFCLPCRSLVSSCYATTRGRRTARRGEGRAPGHLQRARGSLVPKAGRWEATLGVFLHACPRTREPEAAPRPCGVDCSSVSPVSAEGT